MSRRTVAAIEFPDSHMARAAAELIGDAQSSLLLDHSLRVFLFAALIGEHRQMLFDTELLYVAALFHCVGLTPRHHPSPHRFEIDGANAAREFLKGYGRGEDDIAQVWDAIALHTTPGIPEHKCALVALLAAGVETDLFGRHCSAFNKTQLAQVLEAYPREPGFKIKLLNTLATSLKHRPHTAFGSVNADVLDDDCFSTDV